MTGSGSTREPDFDPLDEDFTRCPHPVWAELRERCPVARGARWDFWALTKYQDVKLASRRPAVFTSSQGITVPRNPVSGDGPRFISTRPSIPATAGRSTPSCRASG